MIYTIKKTTQFKQDFKLCVKRGLNLEEFTEVLVLLQNGACLPEKYKDHPLARCHCYSKQTRINKEHRLHC